MNIELIDKMNIKSIEINITKDNIDEWEIILLQNYSRKISLYRGKSDKIVSNTDNIIEKDTIVKDSHRTRCMDSDVFPEFHTILEHFICFYCKTYHICYKQGLNEVAGPFVFLHHFLGLSYARIFNLYQGFIDNYLTNFYYHSELFPLQIGVALTQLLFKYHEPQLYSVFLKNEIVSHFYSTNWLLTAFATRLSLELIYFFWDLLIKEQNALFPFFLEIALLKMHKEAFLSEEGQEIVMTLNEIKIHSIEEITQLFNEARVIEMHTPNSFSYFIKKIGLFDSECSEQQLKQFYSTLNIESMVTLPIFPSELMKIVYPKAFHCFDDSCSNYIINATKTSSLTSSDERCSCFIQSPDDYAKYIIIDLRIEKNASINNCKLPLLPNTFSYEQSDFFNKQTELLNHFTKFKEPNSHFIFITNSTDYFFDFEAKFYHMNKEPMFKAPKKTTEKEVIQKRVNQAFSKDIINFQSNIKKFIEYDTLKTFIDLFTANNIPHLSFLIGGFEEMHFNCLKHGIDLINHEKCLCSYCLVKKYTSFIETIFKGNNAGLSVTNNYSLPSFKAVTSLFEGKEYQAFNCIILSVSGIKKENSSYVIIDQNDLHLYELTRFLPGKSFLKRKNINNITLVANIDLLAINSIQRKPPEKRVVVIDCDTKSFIIDFLSDLNSKSFLEAVKVFALENQSSKGFLSILKGKKKK